MGISSPQLLRRWPAPGRRPEGQGQGGSKPSPHFRWLSFTTACSNTLQTTPSRLDRTVSFPLPGPCERHCESQHRGRSRPSDPTVRTGPLSPRPVPAEHTGHGPSEIRRHCWDTSGDASRQGQVQSPPLPCHSSSDSEKGWRPTHAPARPPRLLLQQAHLWFWLTKIFCSLNILFHSCYN